MSSQLKVLKSQWHRSLLPLLILFLVILSFNVSILQILDDVINFDEIQKPFLTKNNKAECEWYYNKDWWSLYNASHSTKYRIYPLEAAYNLSIPKYDSNEINSSHTQPNPRWDPSDDLSVNCSYNGKIFSIGIQKTGTSSIANALQLFGYKCNRYDSIQIAKTCNNHQPRIGYKNHLQFHRSWRPFAADDISEAIANREYAKNLYLTSTVSEVFADTPWAFLYQLMDEWHPNSKFIYTLRSSTYERVNSALKFELRTRYLMAHKLKNGEGKRMYDAVSKHIEQNKLILWNSSIANMIMPIERMKEFAVLMARVYEKHHSNVMKYFGANRIGIDKDVLVLCLECEQNPWQKIGEFLGCNTGSIQEIGFPHKLSAVEYMPKYFLPRNFSLDWQRYDEYGTIVNNVLDILYDENNFSPMQRLQRISKYLWHFDIEEQMELPRVAMWNPLAEILN